MRAEALIIHLARATSRRNQVESLRASIPLPARIIDAVDGRALSSDDVAKVYKRKLLKPDYLFALSPTEIGCHLSHRAAWRAIVDSDLDCGLIVEDDVAADDPRWRSQLELALAVIAPNDYIRFPIRDRGDDGQTIHESGQHTIVEPFFAGLGAQMQLVGRQAAARLLAASEAFDRPNDSLVQMAWVHGARVLAAKPVVIREISGELGGTVVQKKKMPVFEKLAHEVKRPYMRWTIQRANAKWRAGA